MASGKGLEFGRRHFRLLRIPASWQAFSSSFLWVWVVRMWNELRERPGLVFGGGLLVGLALSAAAVVGGVATLLWQGEASSPVKFTPLHADSATGSDTFAIATGGLDGDMDFFAALDFVSGDLTVVGMNRFNGKILNKFGINVLQHLPVEKGKKGHYLMVTGNASFQNQNMGNQQPSKSAIYVLDANSGKYVIYSVPWSPAAANQGNAQVGALLPLDVGVARNVAIRPKAAGS